MPTFLPFGKSSRRHLTDAVQVYSFWWLEVYFAVIIMLRHGVARMLDGLDIMVSDIPLSPIGDGALYGGVQVVIALIWTYALIVTSRPLRAVSAWMGFGMFVSMAITWIYFAPSLPNWHGLVATAAFSLAVALRHTFQWYYGVHHNQNHP